MDACAAAATESPRARPLRGWHYRTTGGAGMSGSGGNSGRFVPDFSAVFQELSESLRGWAKALGIEADYYDGRIEEGGSNAWGDQLQKATEGAMKTAVSLLTARGQVDVTADLQRRFEGLYERGQAYQQRLEALEDQRRVHVEGLAAQYRRKFDDDPGETRLWALCKGPQRAWTLRVGGENPLETPEQFAEAIDKAFWEEEGGKLRAQAETKRAALDLAEHVELLAAAAEAGPARQVGGIAMATGEAAAAAKPGMPADASSNAEARDDDEFGGPQTDPQDERVVYWLGKRLYLGKDTQIARLFWLLAKPVGRPHDLGEVQRAVDRMETHADVESSKKQIRKAQQRLRTVISKLRKRMREAKLDDHFVIMKEDSGDWPSYSMIRRFG